MDQLFGFGQLMGNRLRVSKGCIGRDQRLVPGSHGRQSWHYYREGVELDRDTILRPLGDTVDPSGHAGLFSGHLWVCTMKQRSRYTGGRTLLPSWMYPPRKWLFSPWTGVNNTKRNSRMRILEKEVASSKDVGEFLKDVPDLGARGWPSW